MLDTSTREKFVSSMREYNIDISASEIKDDDKEHRAAVLGKPKTNQDASYIVVHDSRGTRIDFFNHLEQRGSTCWAGDYRALPAPRDAASMKRREEERQKREKAQAEKYNRAAGTARLLWECSNMIPNRAAHAYLESKGIDPVGGVHVILENHAREYEISCCGLSGLLLVIPIRDERGVIQSLQFIGLNPKTGKLEKRFLTDAKKSGNYFSIGAGRELQAEKRKQFFKFTNKTASGVTLENSDADFLDKEKAICICEGYATGASVSMATGLAVAVAFDCGNLKTVAEKLRCKLPDALFLFCADDDFQSENNPGATAAKAAAAAVGGRIVLPDFGDARQDENLSKTNSLTDFNDLHAARGLDEVTRQIFNAINETKTAQTVSRSNAPENGSRNEALTNSTSKDDESLAGDARPSETRGIQGVGGVHNSGQKESADDAVKRLSKLSPIRYEQVRKDEAQVLGVRTTALDQAVAKARGGENSGGDRTQIFEDVDPWEKPVNPIELLNEIFTLIKRHIICKDETAIAATLWICFTWFIDYVSVAPIAMITAPEKRCGKTTFLDLIHRLSRRGIAASNISAAGMYRTIEAFNPTLLIDEADTFVKQNDELRGVINSGHTRSTAYVIRVEGDDLKAEKFSTWSAKALCCIGSLPETIKDRSIILELRRKMASEFVEKLRHTPCVVFDTLASKLARFAEDYGETVENSKPNIPAQLNDRAQDNWEPLLAIADIAGGEWSRRAREAALSISGNDEDLGSVNVQLLGDIKTAFEMKGVDRISTKDLILELCKDDTKAWATFNKGTQITARQMANRLKEFGIKPDTVTINKVNIKGYRRGDFADAFGRYLFNPSASSVLSVSRRDSTENHFSTKDYALTDRDALTVSNELSVIGKQRFNAIPTDERIKHHADDEEITGDENAVPDEPPDMPPAPPVDGDSDDDPYGSEEI